MRLAALGLARVLTIAITMVRLFVGGPPSVESCARGPVDGWPTLAIGVKDDQQPYLFTEQSVLTLAGHAKISTLDDHEGRDVCSLTTATSEEAPKRIGAIVHSRNRISECIEDLRAERVDAVTTDAAILAGVNGRTPIAQAQQPNVTKPDVREQPWEDTIP